MDTDGSPTASSSQLHNKEPDAGRIMKACALYALNDLLLRDGRITAEKKRAVDLEIWKQYRF